tara:strand:- start:1339 stop:2100 length:762 start_codon:yes stop_codon:yes gene_type:complete
VREISLDSIEIVEDRTSQSSCDEGFLRLSRLRLKNLYSDGSTSRVYSCDIASRESSDAVVAVLYQKNEKRKINVILRESLRPPIYLRKFKVFEQADTKDYKHLLEVVAGVIELGDGAFTRTFATRASKEAEEEVGCLIAPDDFHSLGGESFPSPGISDEKLYFCFGHAQNFMSDPPPGDGGPMEEVGRVVFVELRQAIERCRRAEIPDMKTEVALLRLADALGYIPQLDCYLDELPDSLRERYSSLGLESSNC